MIKPVTTNSYIRKLKAARFVMLGAAFLLLSGCLGGTIAQQLVRSIATSVADNAIANAMDVNENTPIKPKQSITLANRPPNDLALAISRTGFRKANPQPQEMNKATIEKPLQIIRASALVRVKVFNTIIGQEKTMLFEKAKMIGALNMPNQEEWHNWHAATGVVIDTQTPITFIIPPTLGKPISGSMTTVELANIGDINIARYQDNQQKLHQAMDTRE